MSILTVFLLIIYSVYKLNTMIGIKDYKIQMQNFENYYSHTDEWGSDNGFTLAACLTAYDGSREVIEDPSIGQLKFYRKGWSNSEGVDYFSEIASRPCMEEELLGNTEDTSFYKAARSSISDIVMYGPKMKCPVNRDQMELWGHYDTTETNNIMVVFEKCDNSTSTIQCKS